MKLHHLVVGDGPEPVVFLHGLFGQGKNFTRIASDLADVATSYLADLPNHGRSPWTVDFTLDSQADAVAAWLQGLPHSPVTLVGHSLGGKIAMRLALRHPALVSRLAVVDISPARGNATDEFEDLIGALKTLDLEHLESRSQADEALAPLIPSAQVRGFLLQNLRRRGGSWAWAANLDLLADNLHVIGGWPAIEATFEGPVLWIAGGRSTYVRDEHSAPMRALFPRTLQVTLKEASHWVHSDAPDAFTAVLRRLLTAEDDQP